MPYKCSEISAKNNDEFIYYGLQKDSGSPVDSSSVDKQESTPVQKSFGTDTGRKGSCRNARPDAKSKIIRKEKGQTHECSKNLVKKGDLRTSNDDDSENPENQSYSSSSEAEFYHPETKSKSYTGFKSGSNTRKNLAILDSESRNSYNGSAHSQ